MLCDLEGDAMTPHPDQAALEGFLRSSLPARETRAVLAHLLRGCKHCQQLMTPLATAMLLPPSKEAPALPPDLDAAYEAAISAAFAAVLGSRPDQPTAEELDGRVRLLLTSPPPDDQ